MTVQLLAAIILLSGCTKPPTPSPPPAAKQLEVVWKVPLFSDNSQGGTLGMNPVLHGSEVVFNTENSINGAIAPILFLDTANGTILRTYSGLSGTLYDNFQVANEGDYLIFGLNSEVDCINMSTATKQWHDTPPLTWPDPQTNDGYLYRSFPYDYENSYNNSCRLKRTPVNAEAWETVYDFTRTDNYRPDFIGCGFGNLPNGDEVVVWKNWSRTPNNSNRTDIFAYNLTADTLMWRNSGFSERATALSLKIENGIVYGLLQFSAIAIDLQSGTTLWQQDFNGYSTTLPNQFFGQSDFHIEGSHMIVKGPSDELFFIYIANGKVIWVIQDMPSIADKYTYYEGKLFGAGNGISVVDIATRQDLLKDYDQSNLTPNWNRWKSSITIDPLRRVFYCHDGYYAYCIKIPDL